MIINVKRTLLASMGALLVLSVSVFFSQATHAGNSNDHGYNGWYTPEKDAKASVSKTDATCNTPEKLQYGPTTYASYAAGSTPNNTVGPLAQYNVTAIATSGHVFSVNGLSSLSFTGTLKDKKAQSTDSNKDCFVPPTLDPIVTYSDWEDEDGEIPCGVTTVTQTRTKSVTKQAWVWVKKHHSQGDWVVVKDEPIVTTETRTRELTSDEIEDCPVEVDPDVATASVKVLDATCKAGETLVYSNVQHAVATEGSTPDGTVGEPTNYAVTFEASAGAAFDDEATTTFEGVLAGPLTDPSCETGDVLGDTTSDGSGSVGPAVLPNTSGEATLAVVLGGSLAVAVVGLAGTRRLLASSL